MLIVHLISSESAGANNVHGRSVDRHRSSMGRDSRDMPSSVPGDRSTRPVACAARVVGAVCRASSEGLQPAAHDHPVRPRGLAPGEEVPAFELRDLDDRIVGLGDLRGHRTLLINWDPACGFCSEIAPELARLERGLNDRGVQMVLVSRGAVDDNRRLANRHGLTCPILMQGGPSAEVFSTLGTPAAYLVDEHGRVAAPLALGAQEVPELAHLAASETGGKRRLRGERPLTESRIERNGLKPGTQAPSFRLPDLDGAIVSLDDFSGRQLLLVFTDAQCGPCDALLPELVALDREHRGNRVNVIVVGRGDLDENRRKVAQYGVDFPVVVQRHWELSRKFGIFATPVAFLIDERGVIAQDVAKGVEDILTLARSLCRQEDRHTAVNLSPTRE